MSEAKNSESRGGELLGSSGDSAGHQRISEMPQGLPKMHRGVKIKFIKGKGRGFRAIQEIRKGSVILVEELWSWDSQSPPPESLRKELSLLDLHGGGNDPPRVISGLFQAAPATDDDERKMLTMEQLKDIVAKNAFREHWSDGSRIYLGRFISLVNHSCAPNARHQIVQTREGYYVNLHARRAIQSGEEITITYTDSLVPVAVRKEHLRTIGLKNCDCLRCQGEHGLPASITQLIDEVGTLGDRSDRKFCRSLFQRIRDEAAAAGVTELVFPLIAKLGLHAGYDFFHRKQVIEVG